MTKTFEWTLSDGRHGKIVATYNEIMQAKTLDADGVKVEVAPEPTTVDCDMVAYIDGAKIDSCDNVNFWKLINVKDAKKIWGLPIGFLGETADKYEAFLAELFESGKSEEVKAYYAKRNEEKRLKEIAKAKAIIAKAEGQKDIPTAAEAKARREQYNRIHNEGGEGYVPTWITKEEYNNAKALIAE